jgi:hypothetical protein
MKRTTMLRAASGSRTLVWTGLAALALGATACSSGSGGGPALPGPAPSPEPTTMPPPPSPVTPAQIRIVHASPDAPAVDIWEMGADKPLVTGLTYGDTSAYLPLASGSSWIQIRPSPSTASTPAVYTSGLIPVASGSKITAIASGLLSAPDPSEALRVLPLVEGFDAPASGSAIVRIVHAGVDAPTVGIDVGNDNPASPEVAALGRYSDTGAQGVSLPSGKSLQIGIDAAGAVVTAFTTPDLPDGADLFVIATGELASLPRDKSGFSLLVVGPNGTVGFVRQNPTVYALHDSPDAPAVDVYAGTAELAANLSFGQLSAPIQVPPGTYALDFFAHTATMGRPSGSPAATESTGALAAGQRYLAVATGLLAPGGSGNKFQLDAFAEGFVQNDDKNARIRLIHGSPDAPAVDVGVDGASGLHPVLFSHLAFPEASDAAGLSVAPAAYRLGVAPAGADTSIVARFPLVASPKTRAFAVAAGSLAGRNGQTFRLLAVDTTATPWTVSSIAPE